MFMSLAYSLCICYLFKISDVVGIVSETLGNYYRTNYAKCTPFPWSDTTVAGIREFYAPLDILDGDGYVVY